MGYIREAICFTDWGGGGGGYDILIYFSFRIDFLNYTFVCLSVVAECVSGLFVCLFVFYSFVY